MFYARVTLVVLSPRTTSRGPSLSGGKLWRTLLRHICASLLVVSPPYAKARGPTLKSSLDKNIVGLGVVVCLW